MGASHRRSRLAGAVVAAVLTSAGGASAQLTPPVFEGVAYVGDEPLADGVVVLHHLSDGEQGDVDSVQVTDGGAFRFVLPSAPNPARSDIYFASYRHAGVLYFSAAVTATTQLDSVYSIQAYDTLVAQPGGHTIPLQSRSVFFEPDTIGWRVTELYQLRNDEDRTVVAGPDGDVWTHPLPPEATNIVAGEGEISPGAVSVQDGVFAVRAAVPPGERIFVVRYQVESPLIEVPNEGNPELLDVLVREPAPAIDVEGLELVGRIELEAGSTYMRFSGAEVGDAEIRIVPGQESVAPRVEWVAFLLALVLAAAGLFILRPTTAPRAAGPTAVEPVAARRALLEQVASLDEDFARAGSPAAGREAYERRRAELVRQLTLLT